MAVTMTVDGLEEISEMLNQLGNDAQKIASLALYEGAGVMADEVFRSAETIRTEPFRYAVFGTRLPSPEEKDVLLQNGGVGIAKFDKNGSEVTTSVGYGNAGYAEIKGKQKAVAQIANAINSGTSFMQKQPFIRKAANNGSRKATEAIRQAIEARIKEITK